ncbi:type IV secretory system conjugative DNA transfer family protein [Nocardia vaccinii]|uniref:type IV secretory system conjugative DNA transfer family protein n=1 Tax=Nocardia vaccinii TaxID=1822 RepID=UPI00082A272C|nr:type IV secretory system conjugative DNA transfer family protein [Nocardia vaccinii]
MFGEAGAAAAWAGVLVAALVGLAVWRLHARGVPWWVIVAVTVLVLGALAGLAWALRAAWSGNPARRTMRSTGEIRDMIDKDAARRGAGLRASITSPKGTDMRQLAVQIGRIGRQKVYKSFEDFTLVFMGPRSNKTSAVAVPRILSAPGAVVATSNKPDLWILTAQLRAKVGPVYVFDPSRIAYQPQTWWWNLLADIRTVADARRVAGHFVDSARANGGSDREDPFFAPTGKNVLSMSLLAAALGGYTMRDVLHWVDTYSNAAVTILEMHGQQRAADALSALLDLPGETRGGVWGEAQTALATVQDESTLTWVTPPNTWETPPHSTIRELNLWELFAYEAGRAPTLYLMTQEGEGSAGPVIAALVSRIFEVGDLVASAQGGRVDPPMTVVLDECANICKIDRLPQLASHLGSKSICVDAIFQSEAQTVAVWGPDRARALWGAATVRILGAGLQDYDFLTKISGLIGTHKVRERSYSWSSQGNTTSVQCVREPIMPVEDIGRLKKTNALLIRQEARPVLIDLVPWYTEPDRGDITECRDQATREVQDAAVANLGTDNPIAKALRPSAAESS